MSTTPRTRFAAAPTTSWSTLEPVHPDGDDFLHELVAEHARAHRLAPSPRAARALGGGGRGVHPRHPARLPRRHRPYRAARRSGAARVNLRVDGGLMADPRGFLEGPSRARSPERDRRRARRATTARSTRRSPRPSCAQQAAPLHGLRRPLLQQRLPARQPDPRLERPRSHRRVEGRDRPAPRDQQLPRVHRPDLPRPVRVGLRARHQRRPGDDQADRVLGDHRARLQGGLGRPEPAREAHRQDGGRRRLRPRRARRRRRAEPGRPRGHRLRARRGAPAGCSASASPTPSSRSGSIDRRIDCSRRRASSSSATPRSATDVSAERAARAPRRGRPRDRLAGRARPRDPRPRARRRPLRDGVPLPAQPLGRRSSRAVPRASRERDDHRCRQARRRDRRRRHRHGLRLERPARGRRRTCCCSTSTPRSPHDGRYPNTPWPIQPRRLLTTYALDEGGERRFARQVTRARGRGGVQLVHAREVTGDSSRTLAAGSRQRVHHPRRPRPDRDRLHQPRARWPDRRTSASTSTRAATSRRGRFSTSVDGVYAAGDARVGASLSSPRSPRAAAAPAWSSRPSVAPGHDGLTEAGGRAQLRCEGQAIRVRPAASQAPSGWSNIPGTGTWLPPPPPSTAVT